MSGLGQEFWQWLFLLLAIVLLSLVIFNTVMRKLLKVEKKKLFSYNYVNEKHKIIDQSIRAATIVALLGGSFVNMSRDPMDWIWFFEPWFIIMVFSVAIEVARATIEYKYAENRNDYKFTISQLVFMVIMFGTLFGTDFFGMIN